MNRKGWLDTNEAAIELEVSPYTLRNWRSKSVQRGPAFIRIGRRVFYRPEDIAEFIESRVTRPEPRYPEPKYTV